ncbi:Aspartic proteinase-like protein 1 [Ananas comosus]|uniref:Aspartic proteinase-like protein 1 n=1 Tax=Ananas comosus TaxID=4615 RepID=A0A199VLT0_ANACO|nr:Aspartic proteinase-like protein 1 [Ananas comosus]
MALPLLLLLLLSFALASSYPRGAAAEPTLGVEFHHRFSDPVRRWAESRAHPGAWFPEKGSAAYYAALLRHDRDLRLRRRSLAAAADSELTFVDGNTTVRISSLGFLHYALVTLGTPNVTFLAALDTGSDLFWVPCDCQQCAPTPTFSFENQQIEFNMYDPNKSSTSQIVSCNSSFCDSQVSCTGASSNCPYTIQYLSDATSSSGILVEDVLYLTTEYSNSQVVKTPIVFGCGEVQTGSFLDGAAPNGLFGLGLENNSVPSILANKGLASNSFSMCFGSDGSGIQVGNSSLNYDFSAIVDSGTSFTTLADPMYTAITTSFNTQVQESRHQLDPSLDFEYCYDLSPGQTTVNLPDVSLATKGGSSFPVTDPIIALSNQQSVYGYCLAIMNSTNVNIIGRYTAENSTGTLPINSSGASPSAASGPGSLDPEATKGSQNGTQITVVDTSSSYSSPLSASRSVLLVLFVLFFAVL